MTGSAGTTGTPTTCVANHKADAPDDAFEDSNCDGIDGDKSAAIFVSPKGKDDADGSFSKPVKTITEGVVIASKQGKAVYVCIADYHENVVIDTQSVSIYGGYDCTDWSRGNAQPTVAPASGIPLVVTHISGMSLDRMAFTAPDATAVGDSSIGMVVVASTDVKWSHIQVAAGAGKAGSAGEAITSVNTPARAGGVGRDSTACLNDGGATPADKCLAVRLLGGDGAATKCGSVTVHGGTGGAGGTVFASQYAAILGGVGAPGVAKSGAPGAKGADGAPGAHGLSGFGTVSEAGYSATNNGLDGADASVGESGGGGDGAIACGYYNASIALCTAHNYSPSGSQFYGGGGGQGGYGGCAGVGGHGGGAGGASIAVLAVNTQLSLSWASLSTSTGGDGGLPSNGATGQPGGAGGKGGQHSPSNLNTDAAVLALTTGKNGGKGGTGGTGGPGGPGAGGPSITLVALGFMPLTQAATFTSGAGGKGAAGLVGQDAPDGESSDIKLIDVVSPDGGT